MNSTVALLSPKPSGFLALAALALIGVFSPVQAAKSGANSGPRHEPKTKPKAALIAYSGNAVALRIDGVGRPEPGTIIVADTGELPPEGGLLQANADNVNLFNGVLTIDSAQAIASGDGPAATASASLTNYHAWYLTSENESIFVDIGFAAASASASVDRKGNTQVEASATIRDLRVNGSPVTVTGEVDQRVEIPGVNAVFILNHQVSTVDEDSADLEVTAFYMEMDCVQTYIGRVRAGITVSGPPPPPTNDDCSKLTGGGWIQTSSGAKGTFAVSGGIRRGEFWGHLNYTDHGTGLQVKSNTVTNYRVDPANADFRIITYAVTLDGVAGTATVRVSDKGEPGRQDVFEITLSTGYHAAGDLGGARPGGGNIQFHKCPSGW